MSDQYFKSPYERLSLWAQFKTLNHLEPTQGWGRYCEILEDGYEVEYPEIFRNVESTLPEKQCRFVWDVLSVYDAMQRQYLDADKDVPSELIFMGFSGNDETQLMAYCRFLVKDRRWAHVAHRGDYNSHFPAVDMYERMVQKWKELGKPHKATDAQTDSILEVKVHPENR
jgi:uncharacterized protein YfbU (UPF0304 family)